MLTSLYQVFSLTLCVKTSKNTFVNLILEIKGDNFETSNCLSIIDFLPQWTAKTDGK